MAKNKIKSVFSRFLKKEAPQHEAEALPDSATTELIEATEKAVLLTARPREMDTPETKVLEQVVETKAEAPETDIHSTAPDLAVPWKEKMSSWKARKADKEAARAVALESYVQTNRPIRVYIGYVPDVTEKDARYFAAGIAEKNVDSEYISYMGLFKCDTGYAYEIHEGGHGRSYLAPILKYYEGLPPGKVETETAVFIGTAQRMVQVEKAADGGITCIQLPESYKATETPWLKPTKKLKLLRDLNSGLMMASGAFFGVALIALLAAYATRYQPYTPPPTKGFDKVLNYDQLPSTQWPKLLDQARISYVKALRYNPNPRIQEHWSIETAITAGHPPMPAPPVATPAVKPVKTLMPQHPGPAPVPPPMPNKK